jgi:hypothetical protein
MSANKKTNIDYFFNYAYIDSVIKGCNDNKSLYIRRNFI